MTLTRKQALELAGRMCLAADDSWPDVSFQGDTGRAVLIREWVIRAVIEAYGDHRPDVDDITVGVLVLRWTREPSYTIAARDGEVHSAELVRCEAGRRLPGQRGVLARDLIHAALLGLVVRSPHGILSRVAGVESNATMSLHEGSVVGLLLVRLT